MSEWPRGSARSLVECSLLFAREAESARLPLLQTAGSLISLSSSSNKPELEVYKPE